MNNSKNHLDIKLEDLFLKQEGKITGEKVMNTSMDNILFYTNTISAISSNYTYIIKTASDIQKKDKQTFKKLSKRINADLLGIGESILNQDLKFNNILLLLHLILGLDAYDSYISENLKNNDIENLKIWLQDTEFKVFYKKVLLVLAYMKTGSKQNIFDNKSLDSSIYFVSNMQGALFVYFMSKIKIISADKIQSFFSKVFDWKTFDISFSVPLSFEQELIMNEIKTGIRKEVIKQDPIRTNAYYIKTSKYDVVQDLLNNIKIKYISEKEYKHLHHKSPIQHIRKGHWRILSNGKKIWIEEMVVGVKEVFLNAA